MAYLSITRTFEYLLANSEKLLLIIAPLVIIEVIDLVSRFTENYIIYLISLLVYLAYLLYYSLYVIGILYSEEIFDSRNVYRLKEYIRPAIIVFGIAILYNFFAFIVTIPFLLLAFFSFYLVALYIIALIVVLYGGAPLVYVALLDLKRKGNIDRNTIKKSIKIAFSREFFISLLKALLFSAIVLVITSIPLIITYIIGLSIDKGPGLMLTSVVNIISAILSAIIYLTVQIYLYNIVKNIYSRDPHINSL